MLLTTQQAAKRLGVSDARIRQLIIAGKLKAQHFGRQLAIDERDLTAMERRAPGRPKREAPPESE
jgi:excisionase family DNA binding protein